MNGVYRGAMDRYSPAHLAPAVRMPVMVIHGEADRRFPVAFARRLAAAFSPGQAAIYIAPGAGHSESSATPGYAAAVRQFLDERLLQRPLPMKRASHAR